MNEYLKDIIEDIATEELPHGNAEQASPGKAGGVYRLGRLANPQAPEWGRPQDEDMVLLPDEDEQDKDLLKEEGVSAEKRVGLTGTYSSRLFGASTQYFANKIRKQ